MIFPCLWAAPGVPFVPLKLPNGQQPFYSFYGLLLEKTPQRHRCSNNGKRSFIKITPPPSCSYACSLGQHGSHLSPTNNFMRRLLGKTGVLNGHFLACLKWIFGRDKIYSKPNCTSTYRRRKLLASLHLSKLINVLQCILMIFGGRGLEFLLCLFNLPSVGCRRLLPSCSNFQTGFSLLCFADFSILLLAAYASLCK